MAEGTSFYVELPYDDFGNTLRTRAVVEGYIKIRYERTMLIPVAPQHFVDKWPTGWYMDDSAGWVEVDGPARMLTLQQYREIIGGR